MSVGLYDTEAMASWLGKKRRDVVRMVEEDGLPAIRLPGEKRVKLKFSPTMLVKWLNKRSKGTLSVDELRAEIDAAQAKRGGAA